MGIQGDGLLAFEEGNPLTLTKKDSDFVHITAFSNKSQDKDKTKGGENAHSSRTQRLEADSTTAVLFRDNISGLGRNSRHSRSKRDDGDERTIRKEEKTRNADKDRTDGKHRQQTCEKVGKDGALKSVLGSSKGDSRSGSEKANRLHIDSSRSSSKSPNHQVGKSPTHRNGKGSSPHKTRDSRSGSGDSGSSVKSHPDRNVFEHFWAERQRKPDAVVSGKRRHRSTASEASGDDGFSRTVTKLAKADSAKNRSCQESGLSAKPDSSGKQSDSGSRSSDNCANDRKLLGDAHVSMHKVTLAKTNMRKDKGNKETLSGPAADGRGSNNSKSKDSDKHASSKCKTTFKTITKKANDDDEESLFGRQLKSLGTMQPRERLKKPKHSSESKEIPIAYIKGPGDTLGKRPKDLKSRQAETPHQESRGVDRDTGGKNKSSDSRTGQRQSSSKSRSQTPDRVISGDGDELARSRSMRKVAMRRPPLIKDRSVSQDSGRSSERKLGPGQPNKRRRRKKSKKKSSDDEDDDMDDDFNDKKEKDEDLPEGVTWYEEENCASSHCCRPADKRVQWVCCDDCDKWYHTVCVGIAAFEELKDEDFHCGCV